MGFRSSIAAAAALTLAAIISPMLPIAQADSGVTATNGKPINEKSLERVLSIGGDITEILYALGKQDAVVAVDATSQYPSAALKEKKNVGYMRALSAEGVLSINPTLIFASEGAGPPPVVKALKASNVPYVEVPDNYTPEAVVEKIRLVAKGVGSDADGETLAASVDKKFSELAKTRDVISKPLKAIFVLSVQKGMAVIAGEGSGGEAALKLAGLENAAVGFYGYKPMVDEALVKMQPDVIVVMDRSEPNHDAMGAVNGLKGVQSTPAGKNDRVVVMDGLYLLGFGPRAPDAARDLMLAAYPELKAAAGQ